MTPGAPAQVGVVRGLDSGLPDPVAAAVVVLAEPLQLLGRDLADVPEDVGGQRVVLVVAEVDLRDLDARELRLVLEQVVGLLLADGRLHRDRRERIGAALLDLLRELSRRDVHDRREAPDEVVAALARQVADPEPDGRARDVRDHRAPVPVEDGAARRLDPDEARAGCSGRRSGTRRPRGPGVTRGAGREPRRRRVRWRRERRPAARGADSGDRARGRGDRAAGTSPRASGAPGMHGRQTRTSTSSAGDAVMRSCAAALTSRYTG